MLERLSRLLVFILLTASIASCRIMSEVMFKPPKDYQFSELPIDTTSADYTIRPYDVISFAVYTNEGAVMLESSTGPIDTRFGFQADYIELKVSSVGEAEFPVIGNVKIDGLTVSQAQDKVEDIFETMFNRPYVIMRVQNRQVVIFTSPDGNGEVVKLGEQYVSIVEAIALAGGAGSNSEANEIMLFRKVKGKTQSYLIDLSKIEGIKYASAPVESGDIIYVQSRPRIPQKLAAELSPLIIVFSGASVFISVLALLR